MGWYNNGNKYSVRIGNSQQIDAGGYRFRVDVEIKDNKTGKIEKRVGDGRQIGNFSPIWVNWKGKSIQVEKLLDIK